MVYRMIHLFSVSFQPFDFYLSEMFKIVVSFNYSFIVSDMELNTYLVGGSLSVVE